MLHEPTHPLLGCLAHIRCAGTAPTRTQVCLAEAHRLSAELPFEACFVRPNVPESRPLLATLMAAATLVL